MINALLWFLFQFVAIKCILDYLVALIIEKAIYGEDWRPHW